MIRRISISIITLLAFVSPVLADWQEVPLWAREEVESKMDEFPTFGERPMYDYSSFYDSGIDPSTLKLGQAFAMCHFPNGLISVWAESDSELDIIARAVAANYFFPVLHNGAYIGAVGVRAQKSALPTLRTQLTDDKDRIAMIRHVQINHPGEFMRVSGMGMGDLLLRRHRDGVDVYPLFWSSARALGIDEPTAASQPSVPLDEALQRIRLRIRNQLRIGERVSALPDSGEFRAANSNEVAVYTAMLNAARRGRVDGLRVSPTIRVRHIARGGSYVYMMDDEIPDRFADAFGAFIQNSAHRIEVSSLESDSTIVVDVHEEHDTDCAITLSPVGFDAAAKHAVAFMWAFCGYNQRVHRYVLCLQRDDGAWIPTDFARLSSAWGDVGLSN